MTEKGRCRGRARLTSGVSGERGEAARVHCTPGFGGDAVAAGAPAYSRGALGCQEKEAFSAAMTRKEFVLPA